MKLKKLISLVLALITTFALTSCGKDSQDKYEGMAKVVYHLEGGTYKNSGEALTHYYSLENGDTLIVAPETINAKLFPIQKTGYVIEGWYQVKTGEGESATYSNKWNFDYDKVGAEGVTLYARWKKDIDFTYTVCYRDKDGKLLPVSDESVYTVNAGEKFDDIFDYSEERDGYTFLGRYETEDGEPWDKNFVHPGNEESPNVNVVAVYLPIAGDFSVVTSASELIAATKSAKDIYLDADIDLGGVEFSFNSLANKRLMGNGHKIYNFTLKVALGKDNLVPSPNEENGAANTICISLLGNLNKSVVDSVEFADFTVTIDCKNLTYIKNVYFAPLAVTVKESTLKNVKVTGTVIYNSNSFDGVENAIITLDKGYYKLIGENNIIEGLTINVTESVDGN